uniref:Uncharacterized protein n=1 Tax=Rhizophora mucronata TaxID=61149 RepID=A0A2P2QHS1_RHIMU
MVKIQKQALTIKSYFGYA